MSAAAWAGRLDAPPDPPELPAAARPRWPAWFGFAAMGAGTVALFVALIPLVPLAIFTEAKGALGAIALLVLLLVQDGVYLATAVAFSRLRGPPRAWHFGLRPSSPKRTVAVAVLGALTVLGFEIAYLELLDVDETNLEELGVDGSVLGALAVSLALILVAPVTEEIFFRGFFYRALRNRMRVGWAALVGGFVFGALHFQGVDTVEILPVIAVFGIGVCLVYEATASIFAVIAIHASFNTLAAAGTDVGVVVPLLVGLSVLVGCVLVPLALRPAPSPFGPRR
jgi:uncharacterized protein